MANPSTSEAAAPCAPAGVDTDGSAAVETDQQARAHGPGTPRPRTSHLLAALAEHRTEGQVTVRDVADWLGGRSYGLVLLVLALPAWIPVLPPGVASIFGIVLVAVAVQMIVGKPVPWLPQAVEQRGIAAHRFRTMVDRAVPWLRRIEQVCRPRLGHPTDGPIVRLVALWILVLALAICVPFPMTNSGPALSIAVIALGLIERDGLMVAGGVVLGVLSVIVAIFFWVGAIVSLRWLLAG
ncbi:MAG: exopolysaccharide biosynthesis protein [Rhodospirillales bacterium]|nr:MAG: exopolysaccharide biosynthesis protein [Rhodospirillales bacterium]